MQCGLICMACLGLGMLFEESGSETAHGENDAVHKGIEWRPGRSLLVPVSVSVSVSVPVPMPMLVLVCSSAVILIHLDSRLTPVGWVGRTE